MCGCDPEHCRACAISGKSAQWLRGVLPRPTQVHHAPGWPAGIFGVVVAWLSRRTNISVCSLNIPSAPILLEKRRKTRVYAIIWDGTVWNCSLQLKECEEDAVLSLLLIFDMSHVVSLEQFRFLGWKGSSAETLKFIRQA